MVCLVDLLLGLDEPSCPGADYVVDVNEDEYYGHPFSARASTSLGVDVWL